LVVDVKNINLLYFENKASVRTIDTRALSVELFTLHPTFYGEEMGYITTHILQNLGINVKIE